ncbi:unnamed protein product, partial [Gulo gulo]
MISGKGLNFQILLSNHRCCNSLLSFLVRVKPGDQLQDRTAYSLLDAFSKFSPEMPAV